jgi:hypothetical protein
MKTMRHIQPRSALAMLLAIVIAFVGLGTSTAIAKQGLQTRPLHVTQTADFVTVDTCEFGAPLQVITGTGQATHLGRFESYGVACLSSSTNFVTWTVANGDTITIEYTSEIGPIGDDGSASIAFEAVATTGTGRFANVSFGEGDLLAGTVWFALDGSGHLEVSLDGTITYDASDRSDR